MERRNILSDLEGRPIHQLIPLSILLVLSVVFFRLHCRAIRAITALKAAVRTSLRSTDCVCLKKCVCEHFWDAAFPFGVA